MALGILRRVWGEVRQWKTCFEEHGADGRLIDQLMRAFRDLSDIAAWATARSNLTFLQTSSSMNYT
jgi:hypothetical protein